MDFVEQIYMWKQNIKPFSDETLNIFLRKFWGSYILDLAKTDLALDLANSSERSKM